MKVGDLIAILAGDGYVTADDEVVVLGRNKLVVGRGPFVVAEIDTAKCTVTKGIGIRVDADACGVGARLSTNEGAST